jgi:hypothetical protein
VSEYYENLLKFEILYTGERNTAANVFFAKCNGAAGATLDELQTLATSIGDYWGANVMPLVSEYVTLSECTCADWTSADGLTGLVDLDTAGSLTGGRLPDQVAVLLNYQTNLRYRGGRGRMYLPQPDITKLLSGQAWTTAFVGDIEAAMAGVMGTVNDQSISSNALTYSLYHRGPDAKHPDRLAQGVEPVLAILCSPVPGTQRRRVRRVGHRA